MSFRRRLALYGTGIAAVTMVVVWIAILTLTTLGRRSDEEAIRLSVDGAAHDAAEAYDTVGLPTPPSVDLASTEGPAISYVHRSGTLESVSHAGAAIVIPTDLLVGSDVTMFKTAVVKAGEADIRVTFRPAADLSSEPTTALAAAQSIPQPEDDNLVPLILISSIVVLAVAYRASSVVARRAIAPLDRVSSLSAQIASTGDTSRSLEVPSRGKDLATIVSSFNTMVTELGKARDSAERALEVQQRFVADASHELRTPLTTIRSNASFLLANPDAADSDKAEALADIAAESQRMSRMTDELLALARSDAGVDIEPNPIDLHELAADVARQASTEERTVRATGAAVIVNGDGQSLRRLLWILVDNGLKHGEGTVTIETDATVDSAVLTVSDEGEGVPPRERLAVFERFHRADDSHNRPGSGLGLAIAAEIVMAHAGTISVDDVDGAVFLVRLPIL